MTYSFNCIPKIYRDDLPNPYKQIKILEDKKNKILNELDTKPDDARKACLYRQISKINKDIDYWNNRLKYMLKFNSREKYKGGKK
jgi:hypothetical protein